MRAVVLLSGGIDSMACINYYRQQGYTIECVFCDYGQPSAVVEQKSATKVAEYYAAPISIIKTTNIAVPESGEIFGRNALLVQQVLCNKGPGSYKIVLGIHDGSAYTDCTRFFINQMNRVIDCYAGGTIVLEAPFVDWFKPEIVQYCRENDLPISITYSCETGSIPPCGCCASCLDRKELLNETF